MGARNKAALCRAYHKVVREEVNRRIVSGSVKKRIVEEFKERVVFTKTFYRGRFDERHKKWMRGLAKHITLEDKLCMSLDACVAASM